MSDKPERGSWQEDAAYWKARCTMAEAGGVSNEKTLLYAEQIVQAAVNMHVSTGAALSFDTVFEHLLRAEQAARMGGPNR